MKYKFKKIDQLPKHVHGSCYVITDDGHTMFPQDVTRRLNDMERALSHAPRYEWVSVEERLPKVQMFALLYDEDKGVQIGVLLRENGDKWLLECCDDDGFGVTSYNVTHWMPLPNPPE